MNDLFLNAPVVLQSLIASIFTFLITTLGASSVLLMKKVNKNIMDISLSLSSGIMLSAAIFSLLLESIKQSKYLHMNTFIIVSCGMIAACLFLILGTKLTEGKIKSQDSNFKRIFLLIVSIVLHNIPEGMAIGVAFGSLKNPTTFENLLPAISLTLGIGMQNFPEGAAISIPLRREGLKRTHAFIIGSLSGIVEPIAAIIGCILVIKIKLLLPFLLSFAAGAMLFVLIIELIPESQKSKHKNIMAILTIIGFILMMMLEI